MSSINVQLDGPGPFGFRLFGGCGQPLIISKIRKGSKASDADIREGDVLVSINGQNCSNISPADAMSLVDNSGHRLDLNISRSGAEFASPVNNYYDYNSLDSRSSTLDRYGSRPIHSDSGYARHEEISRDGNTERRRTTESETFGGTRRTRVTDESYSNWSSNGHQRPSSAIPANEPVFRTTSATRDEFGRLPANPDGTARTFDLGRNVSRELNYKQSPTRFDSLSPSRPGKWGPSGNQSSALSPLTLDLDTKTFNGGVLAKFSGHDAPRVSPLGSNYQSVWRPSKHETPPRSFEPDQPQVGQTFTFTVPTTVTDIYHHKPWEHTKQEYGRSRKFDEGKENFGAPPPPPRLQAPGPKSWNSSSQDALNLDLDFGLNSAAKSDSMFNVSQAATSLTDGGRWKPAETTSDFALSPRSSRNKMSKFDSDRGFVDPLSMSDINSNDTSRGRGNLPFPELPPDINKILSAPAGSTDITEHTKLKFSDEGDHERKVFSDSSFYADPKNIYPTVEEQVKMARVVAHSLTSGANSSARGQQMFLKRKQKSDAWVVDNTLGEKPSKPPAVNNISDDLHYNPDPWNPSKSWKPSMGISNDIYFGSDIPPPPPLPSGLLFAPKGECKSKGLSADEFERVRLYDQKSKHDSVSPQVCFNLAKDLKESKGKGGRMFAKRRARAEQFTVEGEGKRGPDPAVLSKIQLGYAQEQAINNIGKRPANKPSAGEPKEEVDYSRAPNVNRLKQMIEMPKAKITPWDAVAEYGDVEKAFEHLREYEFFAKSGTGKSYIQSVGDNTYSGHNIPNSFDVPSPPSGPPSWMKNTETKPVYQKPVSSPQTQFNSKPNFSSKTSNGGYRPVQFSAPRANGGFRPTASGGLSDL